MIKVTTEEDYILYEVVCDYCDKEYEITLQTEKLPKQVIECCPFCGNLIEELAERVDETYIQRYIQNGRQKSNDMIYFQIGL